MAITPAPRVGAALYTVGLATPFEAFDLFSEDLAEGTRGDVKCIPLPTENPSWSKLKSLF